LEPPEGEAAMKCPYCGNTVIVPESLRIPARRAYEPTSGFAELGQFGEQMAEVVRLARSGQKISAIKLYREITGVGLAEAKDAVEALERGEAVSFGTSTVAAPQVDYAEQMSAEAVKTTRTVGRAVTYSVIAIVACVGLTTLIGVLASLGAMGTGLAAFLPFISSVSPTAAVSPLETMFPGGSIALPGQTPAEDAFAAPVLTFGEQGSGPGFFDDPRAIAVDRSGNIYVANYSDGRIQRFDPQGNFTDLINVGEEKYVQGLAVSGDGKLYAVYRGGAHVFDAQTGEAQGEFEYAEDHYFDDVAVGADGKLVFVSNGEDILVFNQDGTLNLEIPDAISTVSGDSELDTKIALDGLGNMYALGSFNSAVFKFSPTGRFLNKFGGEGGGPGKFQAVDAIAVDGRGRVYVSDIWGVHVFDSEGTYLESFSGPAQVGVVFGMDFDLQDYLYAATNRPQVVKFEVADP
jgi:sugar lactone lactonase YvrE